MKESKTDLIENLFETLRASEPQLSDNAFANSVIDKLNIHNEQQLHSAFYWDAFLYLFAGLCAVLFVFSELPFQRIFEVISTQLSWLSNVSFNLSNLLLLSLSSAVLTFLVWSVMEASDT